MFRFEVWRHWSAVPASLRRAGVLAVLTIVAASALLYQTDVTAKRPPLFARGGNFAAKSLTSPGVLGDDRLSITSPQPSAGTELTHSSAVISAPRDFSKEGRAGGPPPFPVLANYVYGVTGSESATAFGSRTYPPEMTMTVHRSQPTDETTPRLERDEVIFDLKFSDEHEEREIVAYRENGIVFTYEGGSVTFGPRTQTSNATYDPPMLQIPVPLDVGHKRTGTSEARNENGDVSRTEDWTVEVLGRDNIQIAGKQVSAWVVQIDRQSRPDSTEQVTRTRKYWFDPSRSIWVKWEEKLRGSQDFGPGAFTYNTQFTATLERVEPL